MKITSFNHPSLPIVNSQNEGWLNRVTIFSDGEVRFEEIPSREKNNVSTMEWDGEAIHFQLPDVVWDSDAQSIKEWIENEDETESFKEFKDRITIQNGIGTIYDYVEFYDDYIDGAFEECETDEEMKALVAKHGSDIDAISEEIRQCGASFVNLEYWVENWIERNQ